MGKPDINTASLAQLLLALPLSERQEILKKLTDDDYVALNYDWTFWARKNQLQPSELGKAGKYIWLVLAGRGFGKTRTGGEWVNDNVRNKGYKYVSLVGATAADVRKIMIEGESGILRHSPPWFMPVYEPSKMRLTWPNGAVANFYYGSDPDSSRGGQSDLVWEDELAKWQYPEETHNNVMLGNRLGNNPLCLITTTPKPTKFLKSIMNDPATITTSGNTYENKDNLAAPFIHTVIRKYEGTRLGKQELYAQLLDDNPHALWKREWIDRDRISVAPSCYRLVVAIDPSGTEPIEGKEATETGIVVVGEGRAMEGMKNTDMTHYYVFDDLSLQSSPEGWAREAKAGFTKFKCDSYVAEKNFGGAMVKSTIRTVEKNTTVHEISASRSKSLRAEPASSLYEQGRIHHIGTFSLLEDELCLSGNTEITTICGLKKISDIQIGDYVLTTDGYKQVSAQWMSGIKNVYKIDIEGSLSLLATGNHPVFIKNKGFVKVQNLKKGDICSCIQEGNLKNLTDINIIKRMMDIIKALDVLEQNLCTAMFGSFIMGKSLKIMKYIISIIIKVTMKFPIYYVLLEKNILNGIKNFELQFQVLKNEVNSWWINGKREIQLKEYANIAEKNINQEQQHQNIVRGYTVKELNIIGIKKLHNLIPVYNITVDEVNNYFANGILVHNCEWQPGMKSPNRLDALVHGINFLSGQETYAPAPVVSKHNRPEFKSHIDMR